MTSTVLSPFFLGFLLLSSLKAACQVGPKNWTASPFNPPALPLAVRSPYLNVWLAQGNNPPTPFQVDSNPWIMVTSTGWYASAVVDDKEYRLLGQYLDTEGNPNQTAMEFTATRTSFLMLAGGVQFNMSFLSPIEPKNLTLQSLPFAYLYMTAESTDSTQHRVRMYSDIEGGLIAGDTSQVVQWTAEDSSDYVVLNMSLQHQVPFVESSVRPQDATAYYAFKKINGATVSWSISSRDNTRGVFVGNPSDGNLNNQADTDFRAADSGNNTAVLGIAIDWGNITSTPEPAVWALGVVRNPSVQYRMPDDVDEDRSPYFVSTFNDSASATKFVLDDFPRALSAATSIDSQIRAAGEVVSSQYADLLCLSARQVMGAIDVTIPPADNGTWDTSDVKIFMKNMGSVGSDNGTSASVNNVDALYAAFPVFLYLNPDLGGYLLTPLLEFQDSSSYKLPYAAKNIGSGYPSAIANNVNDPHIYGVDESASMIIMTLAYSLASGDGTLLGEHYNLLANWTEYLINSSFMPTNQSSGDFSANSDFISDNQSNLALKGIIAIAAMAKIAEVTVEDEDQNKFNDTATSAIQAWQDQALSSSHINFILGASDSSGVMYNLYADKLLRLGLVPETVYAISTEYYQNTISQNTFGIPLDNSPTQNTTTNWMVFAASTTTESATRDLLVSQIYEYASNGLNSAPFTSIYDPSTGLAGPGTSAGRNSPAQGGMFALLALNTTSQTVSIPINGSTTPRSSSGDSQSKTKTSTGVIAGVVVASVIVVCSVACALFLFIRRRRRLRQSGQHGAEADLLARPHIFSPQVSERPEAYSYTALMSGSAPVSKNPSGITRLGMDPIQHLVQLLDEQLAQQSANDGSGDSKGELVVTSGSQTDGSLNSSNGALPIERGSVVGRADIDRSGMLTRSEFNTLRREVERMRQEHVAEEEAPPLYSDTL